MAPQYFFIASKSPVPNQKESVNPAVELPILIKENSPISPLVVAIENDLEPSLVPTQVVMDQPWHFKWHPHPLTWTKNYICSTIGYPSTQYPVSLYVSFSQLSQKHVLH